MVGLGLGMMWGVPAGAQQPPEQAGASVEAPEDATRRMLLLNEQGFEAFEIEDYLEAARSFEAAHLLVADPILRKNAAIAWFKAERCSEAREAAVFFLLAEGTARQDRLEARSVLAHCRLNDAAAALELGDTARAAQIVTWAEALQTDEQVQQRLGELREVLAQTRSMPATATPVLGWTLIGMGAAVLASSAALHLSQPEGANTSWPKAVFYGVGALSAGGGLWLVVSSRDAARAADHTALGSLAPATSLKVGWTLQF